MLVGPVIRHGIVQGAHVVPHQHVTHGPAVTVLVLGLQLMFGKKGQNTITVCFRQFIDASSILTPFAEKFWKTNSLNTTSSTEY